MKCNKDIESCMIGVEYWDHGGNIVYDDRDIGISKDHERIDVYESFDYCPRCSEEIGVTLTERIEKIKRK